MGNCQLEITLSDLEALNNYVTNTGNLAYDWALMEDGISIDKSEQERKEEMRRVIKYQANNPFSQNPKDIFENAKRHVVSCQSCRDMYQRLVEEEAYKFSSGSIQHVINRFTEWEWFKIARDILDFLRILN